MLKKRHIQKQESAATDTAPFSVGTLRRLLGYLAPYRGKVTVMYFFALLNVGATLAIPLIMKTVIDRYIAASDMRGLFLLSAVLAALVIVLYVSAYMQGRIMVDVGYRMLYDMRKDLFAHLQHMSFRYFDTHRAGETMSRLTNDVQVIEELLGAGLDTIVVDTLILIGITSVMFVLSPLLGLIVFITLPLLILILFVLQKHIINAGRAIQRTLSYLNAFLNESISGIKVIRSFSREEENIRAFKSVNLEYYQETKRFYPLLAYFWQSVSTVDVAGTALVILGGGLLLSMNMITIGVIAAFLSYIHRFFQPLMKISNMVNQMGRAMASAERIFAMLDIRETVTDTPGALHDFSINGHVQFDSVTFAYNAEETVLEDVSFTAEPGQTVAIVGPTGSGKTTIINLLARFYDPISGSVRVDGRDIRTYSQTEYRQNIALVMQDAGLFSGTIYDAVRYGKPEATDAEIEEIVTGMGFHQSIMALPDGYKTFIGERGSHLSLGQRQLVAFARALIRNPRILILDEASAYLDSRSEALVQTAMERLNRGRTSFVIAHRLSTIRNAHKILVIENGRIQESGTHEELIKKNGRYANLLRAQYTEAE